MSDTQTKENVGRPSAGAVATGVLAATLTSAAPADVVSRWPSEFDRDVIVLSSSHTLGGAHAQVSKPAGDKVRAGSLQYWGISRHLVNDVFSPQLEHLNERRLALLDKLLDQALTLQETRELEYIDWQLSVIEDAELGPSLDRLERLVEHQEKLARLVEDAHRAAPARRR